MEVRDLAKGFQVGPQHISILKGLSLSVKKSEVVAILGQSGSGKSTFLSLLSGLDTPDQGEILVQGKDLVKMNIEERTRFRGEKIGIVFQQFHLIPHLSALENVLLPLEIAGIHEGRSRAMGLLEKMSLQHRAHQHPGKLSGGEAQRVALARALIARPEVILADEPSGSLDPDTGDQVMDVFFDMVKSAGTTAILVTHNPELAERCDRQLILKHGQLHAKV